MRKIKNFLIKLLGGYTKNEYHRIERKYQGLLDSKTDDKSVYISNEYIMRCLQTLDKYAKEELYGIQTDLWASKMFNIIHNNWLRVMIKYVHSKSNVIYTVDTTLDKNNQFADIIKSENIEDHLFILENNDWEV